MSKAALTLHVLLKLIDTFLHGNVEQLNKFSVRHVPLELIDTLLHGNAEQLKIISVRQLFFCAYRSNTFFLQTGHAMSWLGKP